MKESRGDGATLGAWPEIPIAEKPKAAAGMFQPEPMNDWISMLQLTDKKTFKGNEFNIAVALSHCPAFAGKIGFNTRRKAIEALEDTPAGPAGPWTDGHESGFVIWLQRSQIPVRLPQVRVAIDATVGRYKIDPLGTWLKDLPAQWDKRPRLDSWLADYCGAGANAANSLIGSKFLIGAIARAMEPGCRMDYALVLESGQGNGKSTLVKVLGGEWSGENLPDFHSRDAMQIATSSWIIEISELAATRRSDLESVKSFITRTADTYVPKYARHPITVPRWSVLIGSVNPDGTGYLRDTTGNRRFWPVTVGRIDNIRLAADRDQLFAEAMTRYLRAEPWWLEGDQQAAILTEIQAERMDGDSWEEIIKEWFEDRVIGTASSFEIANGALKFEKKDINRAAEIRIGYCMKSLGFLRKRVRQGKSVFWRYERAPEA